MCYTSAETLRLQGHFNQLEGEIGMCYTSAETLRLQGHFNQLEGEIGMCYTSDQYPLISLWTMAETREVKIMTRYQRQNY